MKFFEVWPAPGAREGPQKGGGLRAPTFFTAVPGPRGRPDLKKRTQQKKTARLPSSTQNWPTNSDDKISRLLIVLFAADSISNLL